MLIIHILYVILSFHTAKTCSPSRQEIKVNTPPISSDNYFNSIVSLTNGNFAVAYFYSSGSQARVRMFNSSGANITNDYIFSTNSRPTLASSFNTFMVAYTSSNYPHFMIFSRNKGPVSFDKQISSASGGGSYVKAAGLMSGNYVFCFRETENIMCGIYDESGNEVLAPKKCNAFTQGVVDFGVTALRGGGFVLGYLYINELYTVVYNEGLNNVTNDFKIHAASNSPHVANYAFALAGISNGGFVIAYWNSNVYVKGFLANGTVLFDQKTISSGMGMIPAIAGAPNGGFILTYTGSSQGTYMVLFTNSGNMVTGSSPVAANGVVADNTGAAYTPNGTALLASWYNNDAFVQIIDSTSCAAQMNDPNSISLPYMNFTNPPVVVVTPPNTTNSSNPNNGGSSNNNTNTTNNTTPSYPSTQQNLTNPVANTTTYVMPAVLNSATTTAAAVMGTAVGSSFISGANPTLLWGFMSFLQQFFYLLFLNVDTPDNLKNFLGIFSFANLDIIPNIFEKIDIGDVSSPPNFYDNQFSGLFLKTVGANLEMWVIVVLLMLILIFFRRQNYLSVKIRLILLKSCPIRMWIDSVPPFLIAICLQLNNSKFEAGFIGVSMVICIIFLVAIVASPFYFYWVIKNDKDNSLALHALFEDFDSKDPNKKFYPVYELLKKISAALMIVYAYDYPIHQVLGLAIINTFYFGCLLVSKPRRTKSENYYYLLLEFLSVLIHLSLSFFHYQMDDSKRDAIGYLIIAMILSCVILSSLPLIIEQIKTIRGILKRKSIKYEKQLVKKNKIKVNSTLRTTIDTNEHGRNSQIQTPKNNHIPKNYPEFVLNRIESERKIASRKQTASEYNDTTPDEEITNQTITEQPIIQKSNLKVDLNLLNIRANKIANERRHSEYVDKALEALNDFSSQQILSDRGGKNKSRFAVENKPEDEFRKKLILNQLNNKINHKESTFATFMPPKTVFQDFSTE